MIDKLKIQRVVFMWFNFVGILCFTLMWNAAFAQETRQQESAQEDTRQIKLSGFAKERPSAAAAPAASSSRLPPTSSDSASWNAPTYHRVTPKAPARPKPPRPKPTNSKPLTANVNSSSTVTPTPPKPAPSEASEVKEVGVTIWRLRPAKETDTGPGFSVLQSGKLVAMTPERIEGTSPVKLGDKVRLSIESPRTGYLYVINREQFADGTTGAPALIFPSLLVRNGDNNVTAGRLIDIPDSADTHPFFDLKSQQKSGQPQIVGELITVLITPRPLEGITPGRTPLALKPDQVAKWEDDWSGEVIALLEMNNGAGKTWTQAEKLASETTRALTQGEPMPQTVYRVASKPNDPVMITVQMLYGVN